jgi:hypothetical protein
MPPHGEVNSPLQPQPDPLLSRESAVSRLQNAESVGDLLTGALCLLLSIKDHDEAFQGGVLDAGHFFHCPYV